MIPSASGPRQQGNGKTPQHLSQRQSGSVGQIDSRDCFAGEQVLKLAALEIGGQVQHRFPPDFEADRKPDVVGRMIRRSVDTETDPNFVTVGGRSPF
jgi:hypothetical protein